MVEVTHLGSSCSTDAVIEVLEAEGVVIVDDFVEQAWLQEFNAAIDSDVEAYTPYDYGEPEALDFLGRQTVRLNGLITKVPCYIDLVADERLLRVMDHFLAPNCGQYQLNSSEVIEIQCGESEQALHWDDVIWPVHFWAPDRLLQFNVMIAGTDFTTTNGATRVVPGSHRWNHAESSVEPYEIAQATMRAGSAVFIPGKTLHGGGANTDGSQRRAIVASYVLGWLRTQENHLLHTTVEQAQDWPERVRALLGYELYSHYDDEIQGGPLGYYEYGSPAVLFNKNRQGSSGQP